MSVTLWFNKKLDIIQLKCDTGAHESSAMVAQKSLNMGQKYQA